MAIPDDSVLLSGDFNTNALTDLSCTSLGDPAIPTTPLGESFDGEGVTFTQNQSAGSFSLKGFGWSDARLVQFGQTRTYEVLFSVGDSAFVSGSTQASPTIFVIGESVSYNNYVVYLEMNPWQEKCRIYRSFIGNSGYVGSTPRHSKIHFAIHHPASPSVSDPVRYYINGVQVWTGSNHEFGTVADSISCGGSCGMVPANTVHEVTYYGVRMKLGAVYPNGDTFTPPTSLPGPVCFDASAPLRPWHYIPGPMPWFN